MFALFRGEIAPMFHGDGDVAGAAEGIVQGGMNFVRIAGLDVAGVMVTCVPIAPNMASTNPTAMRITRINQILPRLGGVGGW